MCGAQSSARLLALVVAAGLACPAAAAAGQAPHSDQQASTAAAVQRPAELTPNPDLAADQQRLSDRFRQLEQVVLQLSELTAQRNPRRAHLLREAIARSRQRDIPGRFDAVVQLLEQERLALASRNQAELKQELEGLLQLLLTENRADRLESTARRIRRYLKELSHLINAQRSLKARTDSGAAAGRTLAEAQGELADKTGSLERGMAQDEGEQAADQGNPAASGQQLESARQQMEQARTRLEQGQRIEAAPHQQSALDALQQAKAALEQILRQLREEERQQILVQLEARFSRMLAEQLAVYEGTKRLDTIPPAERDHDDEIEAGRLSRKQAALASEAEKAQILLREEGSSVAFPEAVQQMQQEMQEVAARLQQMRTDRLTQELQQAIMHALEEMIRALRHTRQELENRTGPAAALLPPGQPTEPPLVDLLAELKMIRSLQLRVNRQTEQYRQLSEEGTLPQSELDAALSRLAQQQQRIHQATRDLYHGSNR